MANPIKRNSPKKSGGKNWQIFLLQCIERIGIVGTIVLVVLFVFLYYGTDAQKREFIDKFILLKFTDNSKYLYFIIVCFIVAYLLTAKYYKDQLKLKNGRIEQLEKDLQNTKKSIK